MAARIRKIRHDEETRAKIQAAMIINRLSDHVRGKIDLTPTQVAAARVLLAKILPDLSTVEHAGGVEHRYVVRVPQPLDPEQWQIRYSTPKQIQ